MVDNKTMKRLLRAPAMKNLCTFSLVSLLIYSGPVLSNPFGDPSISRTQAGTGTSPENGSERTAGGEHPFNESQRLKNCELMAQTSWPDIVNQVEANGDYASSANIDWNSENGLIIRGLGGNANEKVNFSDLDEAKKDKLFEIGARMVECNAYAAGTKRTNYTTEGDLEELQGADEKKSALGAQGLECMNQPTPQAQQQCMAQNQGQGELKCVKVGPETHDYMDCKRIINYIDGFAIGKQAMQVQQTYRAGAKQIDLQGEYMEKQRSEEGARITDAMNIQKESLQQQGNLAYEMAAFDAAQAGTLLSMLNNFPLPETQISKCEDNLRDTPLETLISSTAKQIAENAIISSGGEGGENVALPQLIAGIQSKVFGGESIKDLCQKAISSRYSSGNKMFLNTKVRDTMKAIAIKAGLEALANGAKGALLHDQAGLVEDAMKDVEEFEAPDFPIAEVPEATVSECLADPEIEGCIPPTGAGFEGFRTQGLTGSFGGSANLGDLNGGNLNDNEGDGSSGAGATKRGVIPENFGTVQNESLADTNFEDKARAGSIKAGSIAPGGGGGAGAGGGGSGGGGGGGRGPASKKNAPSGTRDINVKTKGTGLGSFGGRGSIGSKKSNNSNPFSKLLGKKSGAGNKTLNFRGPAQIGNKKGSLFEMITNRYNVVQNKDRLLKYKAKE